MNLLQYTSKEMFSSTELIRKSKIIFDKLNYEEIEKAVVLRDGKPSFILLDFYKYEEIINEYLYLKSQAENKTHISKEPKVEHHSQASNNIKAKIEELDQKDVEEALAQIEKMDFNFAKEEKVVEKSETLKDFWDK